MKNQLKKVINEKVKMIAIIMLLLILFYITRILIGEKLFNYSFSTSKATEIVIESIGVSLLENGNLISKNNWNIITNETESIEGKLFTQLGTSNTMLLGKSYQEEIAVKNTGKMGEYVRVIIDKKWIDEDGNMDISKSPDSIQLIQDVNNGWIEDEGAPTYGRKTYYYTKPIAVGETTTNVISKIKIANNIKEPVTFTQKQEGENNIITFNRDFEQAKLEIKIIVNVIQDHNAKEAILSNWGREVEIAADGTLSLL